MTTSPYAWSTYYIPLSQWFFQINLKSVIAKGMLSHDKLLLGICRSITVFAHWNLLVSKIAAFCVNMMTRV